MAKKKHTQPSISQEESKQAQQLLEQYHAVANNLHESSDQKQAETALTEINDMPEGVQMALVKALSKETNTDAADVLSAINALSPSKNVRKEAKRSLIKLEETKIYPHWSPPIEQVSLIQFPSATGRFRFWKGLALGSRNIGEMQLTLAFEEEDDPSYVRILGFLLEFWHDGVKDFFTRDQSKRSFEKLADQMVARTPDMKTKDISLAQARRLVLDALEVNKRVGTQPHRDYRLNVSLVDRLVLQASDLEEDADFDDEIEFDEDEDDDSDLYDEDEDAIDLHDLDPDQVVTTFVESWVDEDFDIAYDLLSTDSPLRQGLSKDEWMKRREDWAEEAVPAELEPNFIHEREAQQPRLWLPKPFGTDRSSTHNEIEIGWSIEIDEADLDDTIPELPKATVVYEETGRHWFWTSYVLVKDQDEWRIQSMTDEGANAQELPVEELQKKVEELDKYIENFAKKHKPEDIQQLSDVEAQQYGSQILWRVMLTIYYTDVLIKKLPLDSNIYETAAARSLSLMQYERCAVYLEQLTQRFAERRAFNLSGLAAIQGQLSDKFFEDEDDERGERFLELAEKSLRESLTLEDKLEVRLSLAELLIDKGEFDEAEDQLLQAKDQATEPADIAHIELHLGEIAMEREEYREALRHYQHVTDYDPNDAESWTEVGEAHSRLGNYEEAETSFKRAIALRPDEEDYYIDLYEMYTESDQPEKAVQAVEEGLSNNPDSIALNTFLATRYIEQQDFDQAEIYVQAAERIDPDSEIVLMTRQVLNMTRATQIANRRRGPRPGPNVPKLGRPGKKKKGR